MAGPTLRSRPKTVGTFYTADHIALLDHLGLDPCHLFGQCIGGPFITGLLKSQPQRIACTVIASPLGRVEGTASGRNAYYAGWVKTLDNQPEAPEEVLDEFYQNLYTFIPNRFSPTRKSILKQMCFDHL